MVRANTLLNAPVLVASHYGMISPPTWLGGSVEHVDSNDWRMQVGCGDVPRVWGDKELKPEGCAAQWYTNNTYIPARQPATITDDSPLRTWHLCPQGGCGKHPWRAPGTAPLYSPCGVDGGNLHGCPAGNTAKSGCAPGGYGNGPDARDWYQGKTRPVTKWKAGSEQEIKWGILANHGGGYSFRLCPMPKSGKLADLTEECFQKGSLEFVGTSWAIFDGKTRTKFQGAGIDLPTGHWRQNPTPACAGYDGEDRPCKKPYQFPPKVDGMAGFAGNPSIGGAPSAAPLYKWAVIDTVKIPANLPTGNYVLSYRHDSEQTAQTWSSCADIHIVDGPTPTPTPPVPPAPTPVPPPPAPTPGCVDKDHSCPTLNCSYCGKDLGGCLSSGCDPSIYDHESTGCDSGQCRYHCKCKTTSEITV